MDKDIQHEFWKAFDKSAFVMLRLESAGGHAEPMTAQLDRDALHAIWFFTSRGNRIATGGKAMAQFSSKGHDVFASLLGNLVEETDRAVWDKHWSREAAAWFPKGREDASAMMLRFDIEDAEVWTADPGIIGTFKLITGGNVATDELGKHAVGRV